MRIRTAIFAVYVLASAVGLAVLMRFMLAEVRPRYINAAKADMQESGRLIAAVLTGHTGVAAAHLLAGGSFYRLTLLAGNGRVIVDRPMEATGASDGSREYRDPPKQVGSGLIDGKYTGEEGEISMEAPVHLADDPDAHLVMARSFRSLNGVIWAERKKLTGIALAVAGVMLVAGWWIAARLTKALERLTRYAQAVRDGKPAQPPQSRAREIAELSLAFEEMRLTLEGRQHAERYVQSLAHGVKAPLAAIRGAAELLDETMPEAQRAKFLANIREESARIHRIIDRLLELSSLEARKRLRAPERIAAAELAQNAGEAVRAAAESARLTLVNTGGKSPAWVKGDGVLLREALVNLLQNAIEFSPSGGCVTLRWVSQSGGVSFSVEDEGEGVPDYAFGKVFERFYSLPRPGATRKSTGLGLALVREIANLHGGEATLENRSEGGARAIFWVPAA